LKLWSQIVKDPEESGVYLLEEGKPSEELRSMATGQSLLFVHLDGAQIENKSQFLDSIAKAMGFPDYFGRNWDALADCLTSLPEEAAPGWVILYEQLTNFANTNREDFEIAVDIFKGAAEFWRNQGKSFHVLFEGRGDDDFGLPIIRV
jgi:RNAse (barnase) inhibitor barstar